MSLTFYKPNSNNKGSLLSVNFIAKTDKTDANGKVVEKGDKSFYFKMVAQTTWDTQNKTGGFKDGNSIVVKISPTEAAGMISAVALNGSLAGSMNQEYVYHDGDKTATTIYFDKHFKKINQGGKWVDSDKQDGFGLRIVKTEKANRDNKSQLAIVLNFAESELFSRYLQDGLNHIFNAFYSEDINRFKAKPVAKPTQEVMATETQENPLDSANNTSESQDSNDDPPF